MNCMSEAQNHCGLGVSETRGTGLGETRDKPGGQVSCKPWGQTPGKGSIYLCFFRVTIYVKKT